MKELLSQLKANNGGKCGDTYPVKFSNLGDIPMIEDENNLQSILNEPLEVYDQ